MPDRTYEGHADPPSLRPCDPGTRCECHGWQPGEQRPVSPDLPPVGHDPEERRAATEHVEEILYDATAAFETGCVLCEAAIRLSIWEDYGFTAADLRNGEARG